jgi:hypothetical protein
MNEDQLLKIHNDPLDPWEPVHAAARIINSLVALYPGDHDSALAARQLDALTPFNRKLEADEESESIESFLWEFWEVVVRLSQAYQQNGGQAQACIVEILGELKKIEAQEVTIWGKQNKLWGSLPLFGPVLTELYGKDCRYHVRRYKTDSGACRYVSTLGKVPRILEQDPSSGFDRSEDLTKLLRCKLILCQGLMHAPQ